MMHHWRYEKMISLAQAKEKREKWQKQVLKVVTLNGSFDLLHAGHLDILEEAKQQGDILLVAVNSDRSVREAKGEGRPVIGEEERAALLAALACVDYIVIMDEAYDALPDVLIKQIKPAVHVNGEEYGRPEKWREWPAMQEAGTAGHVVSRRPGLATSEVINKIKKL
jgi:rfaE bifunctional protein nucleotidyltransferase chain/domain